VSARADALAPLRYTPFRYLAAGRFITMLGNSIAPIALAFAVLDLTGSVRDLGFVVGARSLMNVVFLLFGGVVADRFPRQRVMVVAGVLAAGTQAVVATTLLTGTASIPSLVALSAVNGVVTAFAFPAAAALVPQTVPAALLQPANALNRLGINAAMIVGASAGGILVAAVGPGWGLAVDAASFALAAAAFARVRVAAVAPAASAASSASASVEAGAGRSALRDLHEGWREFTSRTWLWVVVLAFTFINFTAAGAITVLGPAVADDTIGRRAWGFVLAAETFGMVLGGLIALRLRVNRLLRLGVVCMFAEIPIMVGLAEAPRAVILLPAAVVAGIAIEQFAIAWESTMQHYIPTEKLARVYSFDAVGSFIAIPLGQVAAGPAALAWGAEPTLLAGALITLLAVAGMLLSRDVRTLPSGPSPEPERAESPTRELDKISGGQ
jgi:MFS family permease